MIIIGFNLYFDFIPEKAVPDWMPALDRDNHRVSVVNSIWLILFSMIQEIVQNKSNIHFRASHKLVVKSRFLLECLYNSSRTLI